MVAAVCDETGRHRFQRGSPFDSIVERDGILNGQRL